MVDYIARHEGISDHRGFGDFIGSEKRHLGMRRDQDFFEGKLRTLAQDFTTHAGD